MYLAAHGARTPFLAVLALRRPRVLLVVLLPAFVLAVAARLGGPLLDPAIATGVLALTAAPAALALAPRAGALGGRRDTAGAFLLGTLVVWLILVVTGAPGGTAALPGIQAFALAAAVAAAMPKVRDLLLRPIGWIGDAALLVLLGVAVRDAPPLGIAPVVAAGAVLALGTVAAGAAARIGGRDRPSAVIGSGTRDPGVAVALAAAAGGGATAVPLAYAAVLALASAAAWLRTRSRDRRSAASRPQPAADHLGKPR